MTFLLDHLDTIPPMWVGEPRKLGGERNKPYRVEWSFGGKTRSKHFDTESKAWRFHSNRQNLIDKMEVGSITRREAEVGDRATTPISEALTEYLLDMKRRNTKSKHRKEVTRVIERLIVSRKLDVVAEIEEGPVGRWLSSFKPRTANIYLRIIKAFSRYLKRAKYLTADPLEDMQRAAEGRPDRLPRALTFAEYNSLITCEQIEPRRRLWYWIVGSIGLRGEELKVMQWRQIDFATGELTLPKLKGQRKVERSDVVPIPNDVLGRLLPEKQHPNARVFDYMPQRLVWMNDCKRAGIPFKTKAGYAYRMSLRKTFVSHLAAQGTPQAFTQKLARHTDRKLTDNVYTDPALLPLKEETERLQQTRKQGGVA